MAAIWEALKYAYAALAVVPMIPFLLVFLVVHARSKDKKRAIQLSMDVTTLFLIGIVSSLLNQFGTSFGPYLILLFMLLLAGLIGNAQNRVRGKVDGTKLVRAVWRLSFFMLSVVYVLLMAVTLVKYLFVQSA
ncbi:MULTISPECIES: DUF3397 domain-containing protein [Cohnella]|uniref:DUF3397 domain-containing protein n=1 Tax=Cohnella TaxID=329857 RepID=UPI0009BB7D5F|nr:MULTISPECIES: DUF3397 domain-containing protein [Cohnella]MBN2983359.1 DUF3397 domain-containing protein [Cohnella algarum]